MTHDDPVAPAGSRFSMLLAHVAAEHERLLAHVAAEHDSEVQAIKAERCRLVETLARVSASGCDVELTLQSLQEENSQLRVEVLALRARGAAKEERALGGCWLQAAALAAEQEREQPRVGLAACQGSAPLPQLNSPPTHLPGCVEGAPQDSRLAAAAPGAPAPLRLGPAWSPGPPSLCAESTAPDSAASQADASPWPPDGLRGNANREQRRSATGSSGLTSLSQSMSSRMWRGVSRRAARPAQEDEEEDLETRIEKIALDEKLKQLERLVEMFQMEGQDERFMLPFDRLEAVLRAKGAVMARERLHAVLSEIARVVSELRGPEAPQARKDFEAIDLEVLVELVVDRNIMSRVEASFSAEVQKVKEMLITQDVDEIIGKVTRLRRVSTEHVRLEGLAQGIDRKLLRMNMVVSAVVLLSMISLGASMDYAQNSVWWVALEALFGIVFVGELTIKCWIFGVREFFCGVHRLGNWFDFIITLVAILDVVISTITQVLQYADADQQISAARISLALRCVRLARIARLVKLFRAPCMRELANMLSGFFIGMPSLLWVMVLLGFVIYILALALKSAVGPDPGQDFVSQCGGGDSPELGPADNPDCSTCNLYAEEFLYSVPASMIVVFRCVVGDCTSKAGQSLSAHMSGCYTWKFDLVYFLGMVAVVFGLFNIITAIFVQATMDGLQFNHVQNKYALMYESHYVRRKLQALVDRIERIYEEEMQTDSTAIGTLKFEKRMTGSPERKDIMLSEALFYKVIQDAKVNSLFEDLDVKLDHRINTFQLFDLSNDGRVSLVELIQVLMKMRGEPHKSDLVASWAMLEEFRNQFQEFQKTALKNQKELFGNQKDILMAVQGRAQEPKSASAPQDTSQLRAAALGGAGTASR